MSLKYEPASVPQHISVKCLFFRSVLQFMVDQFNLLISPALEATQGQIDGLCSQLPYKCYLFEVASVGD